MRPSLPIPLLVFFSMLVLACTKKMAPPALVPGVSLELAQFRKSLLSNIRYQLLFQIPEEETRPIAAKIDIRFTLSAADVDMPLDFRESGDHLKTITINGESVEIIHEAEHILLLSRYLKVGENRVIVELEAGTTSLNRNPDYLFTLFVPDRARTAFPLFDQPDLKAVFQLTLQIPKAWQAITNAPLSKESTGYTARTLHFAPSDRISSYLFSFVVGDFKTETRTVDGREMTFLHRETDSVKVKRNLEAIFGLHAASLSWLEEYTGIPYPFQKLDFALIPSFPYGGMEHVGAIQYRASSLFLEEDPSDAQLLGRASLIAHETAHMWFGNLVTMEWFNDVWTKEVFANFMAAKIVNPNFPEIDHDLNFMLQHHPGAYSVDRTEGANPIRQYLGNLNEAGQMYGAIIYNKAPIMMRQLELLTGEAVFQEGMREYLNTYAFKNATWPGLIAILDRKSEHDITAWSEVWVNTPGRPHFTKVVSPKNQSLLLQRDPSGEGRIWPQNFEVLIDSVTGFADHGVRILSDKTAIDSREDSVCLFNTDGYGYGLFPASLADLALWEQLDAVTKGSELINLYENMLEQNGVEPEAYFVQLLQIIQKEDNQLLLSRALGQLQAIYWNLFTEHQRKELGQQLEEILWGQLFRRTESSKKKIFFACFRDIALTANEVQKIFDIWSDGLKIEGLHLSESDYIAMACDLALKRTGEAERILSAQLEKTKDGDRKRRLQFIRPAMAADTETRDRFFESLKQEKNRETESWVLDALGYLHHPLRTSTSEKYLRPSLDLLQEIQMTGDIFFPKGWLDVSLGNYTSDSAVQTIRQFLGHRPEYSPQLRMKILQASDMLFRANAIQEKIKE